ncbi:MAG: NAD(P)-binding protein, partial [Lachnospiraceae bacterium]|nr:NAD(P)-binding protein [Lachnospiraceae bacterium]
MIRIEQVKMSISAGPEELPGQICHILGIRPQELQDWKILRRSLDARKKPDLWYVYTLEAKVSGEAGVLKRAQKNNRNRDRIRLSERREYRLPTPGEQAMEAPPVIVGSGPAGLFCALVLARNGYRPVLLERGGSVEERTEAVRGFWESGRLDPECNVQFGEGGAGTFSDGKLNTLVKDPEGRARKVLEIFTRFGAEESIVYDAKPH